MRARPIVLALRSGALTAAAAVCLLFAGSAQAKTPITYFSAVPSGTQAGGHPDVEVRFGVSNRVLQQSTTPCDCEDAKNAAVHLPAGFIGNPHATPQCTIAQFSSDTCPIDSQVGIVNVLASGGFPFDAALYNLDPPPDVAGLLGFKIFIFDTPQFTVLSARTGSDYGLDATATSIYHGAYPIQTFQQVLWGIPADPSHDPLRLEESQVPGDAPSYLGELCDENGAISTADPSTVVKPCNTNFRGLTPVHSNSPLTPFLQNPTTCASPLLASLDLLSYDGGTEHAEDPWPQMTGCDQLSFDPSLYAQPTTTETDTASGIDVNLTVPQELSPTIPSPTELREAVITLPPGFSINPNAADGKTACTDTEARFGTEEEAQCPEFARVGSLEIDSSALPGPIPGSVYLGQPLPGYRYRIFLVANGFATHIKLAGTVSADPATGQLVITFKELPQSPLTAFDMHFFGSERGLLATPTKCGTYPVTTTFTPWDETIGTQTSTQFFTLDSGPSGTPCPGKTRPFAPKFEAASSDNTSGAHSPFAIELTRNDGNQNLSGLTVTAPPGFSATLTGVPYCSDTAIAAASLATKTGSQEQLNPSCPAASQIGTAATAAGAGNHPVYVSGKVYLAGPYKGAPLSLVVITPAISGPYDLGNVVIRAALQVNPETVQVTAVSDPLPQILEGIPLRLRSIRVDLNRKNFILNPTNCDPFSVSAQATGDEGGEANLTYPFQMANCSVLPFAPRLSLKLGGGLQRLGHPTIRAVFHTAPGEANPRSVSVTLPPSELIDNAHFGNVCTKTQFAAQSCPSGSLLGHATVTTPLLGQPLSGPIYLRSSSKGLPNLALDLSGQFHVVALARVDTVNGGLRTTFETVPDVPLGTVSLALQGGSKGLVENSTPLCGTRKSATAALVGQNGRSINRNIPLQVACAASSKRLPARTVRRNTKGHR